MGCIYMVNFHQRTFNFGQADWDGFCDFLRDVPWHFVFDKSSFEAASDFTEWVQAGTEAFIPSRKFQVQPNSPPWFNADCAAAISHRNHFYHRFQREQSDNSKVLFRRASNQCKRVIAEAKAVYTTKIKNRIATQALGSRDFWRITNSVLHRGKSAIPPLSSNNGVVTSSKDKANLFANQFASNSTLDDSHAVLPDFPSKTDQFLDSVLITPKLVLKLILTHLRLLVWMIFLL